MTDAEIEYMMQTLIASGMPIDQATEYVASMMQVNPEGALEQTGYIRPDAVPPLPPEAFPRSPAPVGYANPNLADPRSLAVAMQDMGQVYGPTDPSSYDGDVPITGPTHLQPASQYPMNSVAPPGMLETSDFNNPGIGFSSLPTPTRNPGFGPRTVYGAENSRPSLGNISSTGALGPPTDTVSGRAFTGGSRRPWEDGSVSSEDGLGNPLQEPPDIPADLDDMIMNEILMRLIQQAPGNLPDAAIPGRMRAAAQSGVPQLGGDPDLLPAYQDRIRDWLGQMQDFPGNRQFSDWRDRRDSHPVTGRQPSLTYDQNRQVVPKAQIPNSTAGRLTAAAAQRQVVPRPVPAPQYIPPAAARQTVPRFAPLPATRSTVGRSSGR